MTKENAPYKGALRLVAEDGNPRGVYENREEFAGMLAAVAVGAGIGLWGIVPKLSVETRVEGLQAIFETSFADTGLVLRERFNTSSIDQNNLRNVSNDYIEGLYGKIEDAFLRLNPQTRDVLNYKSSEPTVSIPVESIARKPAKPVVQKPLEDDSRWRFKAGPMFEKRKAGDFGVMSPDETTKYVTKRIQELSDEEKMDIVERVEEFGLSRVYSLDGFRGNKKAKIVRDYFPDLLRSGASVISAAVMDAYQAITKAGEKSK